MTRARHALTIVWTLLLSSTGCLGGLSNAPFVDRGSVEGQLGAPFDPARAWIVVEGVPATLSGVDAEGRFRLDGVPAGEQVLIGATGEGHALHERVAVLGGRTLVVTPAVVTGAQVRGLITLRGDDEDRRAEVALEGLPETTKVDAEGRYTLQGLPPSCFTLRATHPTHRSRSVELCLQPGERRVLDLQLEAIGGEREPSGLCGPCDDGADCASGLCLLHDQGSGVEQVCSQLCQVEVDCPPGFGCEEDEAQSGRRVCLPRDASCSALQNLGAPCATAGECGLDTSDGVCVDERCTLTCEEDHDCPLGLTCSGTTPSGERACR